MLNTPIAHRAQDTRKPLLLVRIPDREPQKVAGRMAWALERLIQAGDNGVTTLEEPAPRWSDYIFKLRRVGIWIETETETHGGPFSGTHGRYRLVTPVEIERVAA
jgi:hypothetical protein